jgi:hypothetical protein
MFELLGFALLPSIAIPQIGQGFVTGGGTRPDDTGFPIRMPRSLD